MDDRAARDERELIAFWDRAFVMDDDKKGKLLQSGAEIWRERAPSVKLFEAAVSLGERKRVLDYGCGAAWAAVIAAKSGCPEVTAADPAEGAVRAAEFFCALCGTEERVHPMCIPPDWLSSVPDAVYDGFICSNVLDVVPEECALKIIRQSARVVTEDAEVIIGLNYHLTPDAAAQRGMILEDGRRLYVDGVLRLVSRPDGEWEKLFSPYYTVKRLEHFAWPGEKEEKRRLFYLRKKMNG